MNSKITNFILTFSLTVLVVSFSNNRAMAETQWFKSYLNESSLHESSLYEGSLYEGSLYEGSLYEGSLYEGSMLEKKDSEYLASYGETDAESLNESNLIYLFMDKRLIKGHLDLLETLQSIIRSAYYICLPGDSICPDLPVRQVLMMRYKQLKKIMNTMMDHPESVNQADQAEDRRKALEIEMAKFEERLYQEYYQTPVDDKETARSNEEDFAFFYLPIGVGAVTLVVASYTVGALTLEGCSRCSSTMGWFLASLDQSLNAFFAASANTLASGGLKAFTACTGSCFSNCGRQCEPLKSVLSSSMNQEVSSGSAEIIEESIISTAITGIAATGLRLFNQLPYAGYIRFSEDVVVPSALILLHTASQLSTRQNSHKSRQLIETAVGAVAYAQITSKYNPGFYINELAYMAKNGMNLLFFMCETPLEMGSVAAGKLIIGTLMDECSTSVNSMAITMATALGAGYFEARNKVIPGIDISPRMFLAVGMIAGDSIASINDDHPEYLLIPLIILSTNIHGRNNEKAIGWGTLLLYPIIHYFRNENSS